MKGNSISIFPILVMIIAAMWIQTIPTFLSPDENMVPKVHLLQDEEIDIGTWAVFHEKRYVVWDIRHAKTKQLAFMTITSDGAKLVKDMETLSYVIAIRLTIHAAEIVGSINSADENIGKVENALAAVSSISELAGEGRFATEVYSVRSQISRKTQLISELSSALEVSKKPALRLVENHTDTLANAFLNSLIVSGVILRSEAAATVVSLMLTGSRLGWSPGWIDMFLDYLDSNLSPLEALARTYGMQQAAISIQKMKEEEHDVVRDSCFNCGRLSEFSCLVTSPRRKLDFLDLDYPHKRIFAANSGERG